MQIFLLESLVKNLRCELKNINSVKFMMKAVEYEAYRQIEIIENGDQ